MLISAWLTAVRNRLSQTRTPLKRRNTVRAEARLEDSLESRALLAGPSLVAVRPNIGAFLTPGETRYIALCYLDRRLYVLCFTETETGIRVISFRKANEREASRYGKAQTID